MTSFWPDVRVRVVEDEELGAYGDVASMFLNLNTPEDYDRVRPR
jgi:molybdopterin-guanine dinucleotide biosynthesis protein A